MQSNKLKSGARFKSNTNPNMENDLGNSSSSSGSSGGGRTSGYNPTYDNDKQHRTGSAFRSTSLLEKTNRSNLMSKSNSKLNSKSLAKQRWNILKQVFIIYNIFCVCFDFSTNLVRVQTHLN